MCVFQSPPPPPPKDGFRPLGYSLNVNLFEEGNVRKCPDYILVDHLPKLVVLEELVPGTLEIQDNARRYTAEKSYTSPIQNTIISSCLLTKKGSLTTFLLTV